MSFRLLGAFEAAFKNKIYKHRDSTVGDFVAAHMFDDLLELQRSGKLVSRITGGQCVVNGGNKQRGSFARRGDGTFGEIVPGTNPSRDPEFSVLRGEIATIEIGVEVKILAKAMIKQIDRVQGDLERQSAQFKQKSTNAICVGIVGINQSLAPYTGYEGDRAYPTDGKKAKHPAQEAPQAEDRLWTVRPAFNEFLILRFRATNVPPYPFEWVDFRSTEMDYGAILARVSRLYEDRF